jgi:GntR family transcriptional repressor for pyruvate dehydrogenase complex
MAIEPLPGSGPTAADRRLAPAVGSAVPDAFRVAPIGVGPLEPLAIRTAGERIADRFVTAIALGQFVPGQRLPSERELAAMLQVSRATVREALARLASGGYTTARRGRGGGTFVTAEWGPDSEDHIRRTLVPEWERFEQLLDFRSIIEQQVARVAAQRRTRDDVRAIKAALLAYENAGGDRESSSAADLAVHRAVASAAHNEHILALSLQTRRDISLGFGSEPYSAAVRGRALDQHPRLAAAVIAGDPEEAAAHAGAHFSLTEDKLRELHDRVDVTAAPTGRRKGERS